jgi:hypothetical protein
MSILELVRMQNIWISNIQRIVFKWSIMEFACCKAYILSGGLRNVKRENYIDTT